MATSHPSSRVLAFSRRSLLVGGSAVSLAAVLAACSGSTDKASTSETTAASAATDTFPVTVEHTFGSTTIKAEPKKIATIGWVNEDVVIALGVVPVGVPAASWGGDDNGSYPWTSTALEALGAGWGTDKAPTQYAETDGPNVQAIAALEPDLILGVFSGMTQEQYDQLSAIAPTIAFPKGGVPYGTPWQDTTTVIGKAMGRTAAAEALVKTTEESLAAAVAEHPELKGASYVAANVDAATQSISLYSTADNRGRFFELVGMKMAEAAVAGGADSKESFFVDYSAEKADELKADLFWSWAEDEAAVSAIKADPLLSTIPSVADGTAMFVTDKTAVMSISASSPLSLPWCCENHVPDIAKALSGKASSSASATSAS